ncbi:MAG: zinc ABC transporter substrate-binding protein [Lachnospiraceae bacterium]|nr:zinc ABC transporter substrate-binding protein [Lachnospiraceae bacterium]
MVSIFMMLSLFGCSKNTNLDTYENNGLADDNQKIEIVAVNFPAYDFARAVAGDKAEITMLISPGNDVHSYEPTPQDMITIGNCDLFIYTGGESDVYIEEILDSFSEKDFATLKMMDYVTVYEEETVEGMQVRGHSHDHSSNVPAYEDEETHVEEDMHEEEPTHAEEDSHKEEDFHAEEDAHGEEDSHAEEDAYAEEHVHEHEESHEHEEESDHDHEHEEYDEHVWTSPQNAIKIITGIEEAIANLDYENAEYYKQNAQAYIAQLQELHKKFEELFVHNTDSAIFVGDRFPFLYFAKEYGITYYAVFPSCNGESEPSAKTMAFFIEEAREYQTKTIFYLELSNDKTARAAAEAIGAATCELHSGHNVTKEDFEGGVTYVDILKRNYHALREAF